MASCVGGMGKDGGRELRGEREGARMDSADAVLAALDPEQREVALAARGPVCVLAGAGTGKTRAVAHRIAYGVQTGVVSPGHVLAVTFTTRAAGELRGRLRLLPGRGGVALCHQLASGGAVVAAGQLCRLLLRLAGSGDLGVSR